MTKNRFISQKRTANPNCDFFFQTEVVVPRALGDGSIIGTTVIQPSNSQARKGILKRSANQDSAAQNKWDYELSPSSKATSTENIAKNHFHHAHQKQNHHEPDILQLPMGLPPPPGTTVSGRVKLGLGKSRKF